MALGDWWRDHARAQGAPAAASLLLAELWGFVRDSTPNRSRSRYGDMDYDWEHRVNTTSGTVNWRERLLGIFYSPYQPTDPSAFREMMGALPTDFREFTFIDIGSGKGRTLLMASEYPFPKIVGVELIAELHRAAEENIVAYRAQTPTAHGTAIESVCMDACEFVFPATPLLVYLFNPLPEARLRQVMRNLEESWRKTSRPVWIVYHNPALESALAESQWLQRVSGTAQYSLYTTR
ncbi:MAG: class I SAM-dependent methyltransferase [Candidatus Sulfotelmatobacter sp.]